MTPASVAAGSTGKTVVMKYTAPPGTAFSGTVAIVVPTSGGSSTGFRPVPALSNITVQRGTCTSAKLESSNFRPVTRTTYPGTRISVIAACPAGKSFTLTYTGITAPQKAQRYTFHATAAGLPLVTQAAVTVTPGPATRLAVTGPATAVAGAEFSLTVTAKDAYYNYATGYRGTVAFTSADPGGATLPANYTYTATDRATHTFTGLILRTGGARSITTTDTAHPAITGSATLQVSVPPGVPVTVVAGLPTGWPEFTVGSGGDVYVASSRGPEVRTITRYRAGTAPVDVVTTSLGIRGLSVDGDVLTWLEGRAVHQRGSDGQVRVVADIAAHELATNPDAGRIYGPRIADLSPECAQMVQYASQPAGNESNPTSTVTTGTGVYVTDYAAGTVVRVEQDGTMRTVALLPIATVTIDEGITALHGWPDCTLGARWDAQRQPTDVAVGPGGVLYVTAQTSITHFGQPGEGLFRIDPGTGAVTEMASGFDYLGSVAVAPDGTAYLAHGKFGESLERVDQDGTVTVMRTPGGGQVSMIEWYNNRLYAGLNEEPASSIVAFTPVPAIQQP